MARVTGKKNPENSIEKQTFLYKENESIVSNNRDEIILNIVDFDKIYRFFVLHSPVPNQSRKIKTFSDYGWTGRYDRNGLKTRLESVFKLDGNEIFLFTEENNMRELFSKCDLSTVPLIDIKTQRGVIGKTNADNHYLKLFYRVRDCLAHGNFKLFQADDQEVFVMQDNNQHNVTARFVIWKSTLLSFIDIITNPQNHLLNTPEANNAHPPQIV